MIQQQLNITVQQDCSGIRVSDDRAYFKTNMYRLLRYQLPITVLTRLTRAPRGTHLVVQHTGYRDASRRRPVTGSVKRRRRISRHVQKEFVQN